MKISEGGFDWPSLADMDVADFLELHKAATDLQAEINKV